MVFNRALRIRSGYLLHSRAARQLGLGQHSSRVYLAELQSLPSGVFLPHRGYASRPEVGAADARSLVTRLKNLVFGTAIGASLILGYYYITDTRASVHRWLAVPSLRWIYPDAEEAHEAGTKALKALYEFGLHPRERADEGGDLEVEVRIFRSRHTQISY